MKSLSAALRLLLLLVAIVVLTAVGCSYSEDTSSANRPVPTSDLEGKDDLPRLLSRLDDIDRRLTMFTARPPSGTAQQVRRELPADVRDSPAGSPVASVAAGSVRQEELGRAQRSECGLVGRPVPGSARQSAASWEPWRVEQVVATLARRSLPIL